MAQEKLTTAEILARARRQGAAGSGGGGQDEPKPSTPQESSPVEPSASAGGEPSAAESAEPSGETASPKPSASKPRSTAEILAAARAQKGGGATGKAAAAEKPASADAKPQGTADILAAARAQGAGGGAAQKPKSTAEILAAARAGQAKSPGAGASPAAKSTPAAKVAPKAPPGERPSVQEMVRAAREGAPLSPPATVKPKLPARPPLPTKVPAEVTRRRSFFSKAFGWMAEPLTAAWVAMGAIAAVWSLAAARFMMPNMIVEPPSKFKIGPPSDYPLGTVSTKWTASRGIWIVHTDQYDGRNLLYALLSVCTHLGCTPNWLDGEQKFKCPCHGSGFYITGINFEGPAPRPLERVGIRLAEDGSLEVDKSVKFQEELGQWQDPASFVEVA